MVVTEDEYEQYANKIHNKTREHEMEIKEHKGYHGRKKYYPFKMDEWEKAGKELPKKHATELKEMNNKLKKMRIDIDKNTIKVPTEDEYGQYANKIRNKTREHEMEIKHHKGYHGRKKYYPFKMDEWEKAGKELPKKHATELKEMNNKLKKMRIDIDEHHKKLMDAATKGPTCAICLEDKYAEEGPNMAVSFNKTTCKKHIFHEQCVGDGRVKFCPLCRNATKKLTKIEISKLRKLYSSTTKKSKPKNKSKANSNSSTSSTKSTRKRCPNGTRRNKKSGRCESK